MQIRPSGRLRAPLRGAALAALVAGFFTGLFPAPVLAAGPNVVVKTGDTGPGSLREAINYANAHPGTTVSFQIPAVQAVGGIFTLKPTSALPAVTANGTQIDATTQTSFTGNTNPAGPEVVLNGSLAGGVPGIQLQAANGAVKGMVINGFGTGIRITGAAAVGNKVQGCYIGTDAAGTSAVANSGAGVEIYFNATNTTIGGTTQAARNVISGNGKQGVYLSGSGTSGNLVQGNTIGADAGGTVAVANSLAGVRVTNGTKNNTIGGMTSGAGNLISGNGAAGVEIVGAGTTGNLVVGNLIGLSQNGAAAIPNAGDGVNIGAGADSNTIGGTAQAARNVISGNAQNGIVVAASSTLVQGNYIGTNKDGSAAVPNQKNGVIVDLGGHDDTIGGTAAGVRNVISGNKENGVSLYGAGQHTRVQGNFIGVNAAGGAAVSNLLDGVRVSKGSTSTTVGGTTDAARNVISGNGAAGVEITDPATESNGVQGNYIGTNKDGVAAVPNSGAGVLLTSGAHFTLIGNTAPFGRNIISGNAGAGILVSAGAHGGAIVGNRIGTNAGGSAALPNAGYGVILTSGATEHTIGGLEGNGNLISGNGKGGLLLEAQHNYVFGNLIGVGPSGASALPNNGPGIEARYGPNIIGAAGVGNVVSGNTGSGILFTSANSYGSSVKANLIGLNSSGTAAVPNSQDGVAFAAGAHANYLVGTLSTERNVISGNLGNGVHLYDGGTTTNSIQGNYIGTNAAGTSAVANGKNGVYFAGGSTGPSGNFLGGVAGTRNVISGNTLDGVRMTPRDANHNWVVGNYIGVTASGAAGLPNGLCGVALRCAVLGVTDVVISANVISANKDAGIYVHGLATDLLIEGNTIGLDATGTTALPNKGPGIWLINKVSTCTIGGLIDAQRNVIAGNEGEGIRVETDCASNLIRGNYIGTDATGLVARPNGSHGVLLADGTTSTTVGGTLAGSTNVISGNPGCGIVISGAASFGNHVQANYIGTDKDGAAALPNAQDGVRLEAGTHQDVIGGTTAAARNVISGNTGDGVKLRDTDTTGNLIRGNYIGTNKGGIAGVPNAKNGVEVALGASANTIGGPGTAYGNRIAYNTQDGVLVRDANTQGISIRTNEIHDNGGLGINLELTGATGLVTPNDSGDSDSGPNGLQNFPTIQSVTSSSDTTVEVRLIGFAPGAAIAVDLYYGLSIGADPSGYGEGAHFLGTKTVTTNAFGAASFSFSAAGPHSGSYFTATATDVSTGNTSEFSAWKKTPLVFMMP